MVEHTKIYMENHPTFPFLGNLELENSIEEFSMVFERTITNISIHTTQATCSNIIQHKQIGLQMEYPMGFFDGAAQRNTCGCGFWIAISTDMSYMAHWNGVGAPTPRHKQWLYGVSFGSIISLAFLTFIFMVIPRSSLIRSKAKQPSTIPCYSVGQGKSISYRNNTTTP